MCPCLFLVRTTLATSIDPNASLPIPLCHPLAHADPTTQLYATAFMAKKQLYDSTPKLIIWLQNTTTYVVVSHLDD
ncbi:hypothetical protein BJV82DRAFT_587675 [Fennellomyces sp. T-0311]|nr:hypothetical protein BJV82DRAFT_587675 [Fennellomyces sp. T-0311]